MNEPDFQSRVLGEIKVLDARDADLAAKEETIRRERAEIRARASDLTRVLTVYKDLMGLNGQTTPDASPLFPEMAGSGTAGATAKPTIADIAEQFIAAHGGRAKVSDIVAELVRVKRLKGSHGDYGTVFGTLSRNKRRFMKVGTGEFALLAASASAKP